MAKRKMAALRPIFRPLYRRLSASCVHWAVGARWGAPRFRFWCFSTSVSRPTKKVPSFFDFKHHHSTHPDGPAFCGCSGYHKSLENTENFMRIDVFGVSGGAGTRGTGGATAKSAFSCALPPLTSGRAFQIPPKHRPRWRPLWWVFRDIKKMENTKVLLEIDVFVCLVVQEPGVPGGFAPPDPP